MINLHRCNRLPNPSLNVDVPHAGFRPGSGQPASLFR
jgi:hypothetical protein